MVVLQAPSPLFSSPRASQHQANREVRPRAIFGLPWFGEWLRRMTSTTFFTTSHPLSFGVPPPLPWLIHATFSPHNLRLGEVILPSLCDRGYSHDPSHTTPLLAVAQHHSQPPQLAYEPLFDFHTPRPRDRRFLLAWPFTFSCPHASLMGLTFFPLGAAKRSMDSHLTYHTLLYCDGRDGSFAPSHPRSRFRLLLHLLPGFACHTHLPLQQPTSLRTDPGLLGRRMECSVGWLLVSACCFRLHFSASVKFCLLDFGTLLFPWGPL